MKCPFCGNSNPDKAKVCEECGSALSQQNDIVEILDAEETVSEAAENAVEEAAAAEKKASKK